MKKSNRRRTGTFHIIRPFGSWRPTGRPTLPVSHPTTHTHWTRAATFVERSNIKETFGWSRKKWNWIKQEKKSFGMEEYHFLAPNSSVIQSTFVLLFTCVMMFLPSLLTRRNARQPGPEKSWKWTFPFPLIPIHRRTFFVPEHHRINFKRS